MLLVSSGEVSLKLGKNALCNLTAWIRIVCKMKPLRAVTVQKCQNLLIQDGHWLAILGDEWTKNNRFLYVTTLHILTKFHQNLAKNKVCRAVTVQKCQHFKFKIAAYQPVLEINEPNTIGFLMLSLYIFWPSLIKLGQEIHSVERNVPKMWYLRIQNGRQWAIFEDKWTIILMLPLYMFWPSFLKIRQKIKSAER